MKKLFQLLLLLSFVFAPFFASAEIYYVRTDGSNSNNGLSNSAGGAWLTIDYAADRVSAGDTIRVQAGTYQERVTPGVSGSSVNNTVTFVADGDVTVCGWETSSRNYIRIIGFNIDCGAGTCNENNNGINLTGTNTGIEIWNNTISNCNHYDGIRMSSTSNPCNQCIFIGNDISDCLSAGSSLGIRYSGVNSLISHNSITNIAPDGLYIWGSYNIIRNNYIHDLTEDLGGHADFFQTGQNSIGFQYNLFEANFGIGKGTAGDEHGTQFSNNASGGPFTENILRRNIFHNVGQYSVGVNQVPYGFSYIRIYNNTECEVREASPTTRYGIELLSGTTNTFIENNIFYESWGNSATSSLEVFYVASGGVTADYNLAYDPQGSVTFASNWTSQAHEQSNSDPDFSYYDNDDFTISNIGGAYGNGGPLTTTSGSGTGTTFNVASNGGGFFRGDNTSINQYGGNLVVGDTITVGTDIVRISSISGDAITVTSPFTWANGENVYYGDDTSPDIGAYPYKAGGYNYTATYSKSGETVTVTPYDASLVRMVVVFEDGVPIGADSISPYSISGVGSGTLDVRVYPLYASKTLYVSADSGTTPAAPTKVRIIMID